MDGGTGVNKRLSGNLDNFNLSSQYHTHTKNLNTNYID